ncbi:MAG: hypothetical protein AB1428_08725 [Bacteroidota bacterium]
MRLPTAAILAAVCALCTVPGTTSGQEQYSLHYAFEKGKVYRFHDTIAVKSTQEMMGQEMKTTSNVFSTTKLVASDVAANGTAVLMVSPEAMSLNIRSARGDTTITPIEVLGKRSRVTVSRLGHVSAREVVDTVKLTGIAARTGQRELMRFHVFSEHPVNVGGTWTSTQPDTSEAMGSKIVTVGTIDYTVVGKELRGGKECLKISFKRKATIAGKGMMMGNEFFLEGTGTGGGLVFIDPATGFPLSEESTMDMETTVALTGQQNMTIPSSQSVTSRRAFVVE